MTQRPAYKLSICIGTFNRARFIGATLESIIAQAGGDCEIVVSDNASTDDTERVVAEYVSRFDRLRYVRQDTNKGIDCNFDAAVKLARGEYCWLFPDDDLMKPNAVPTVLKALDRDLSLVIVNVERRDFSMSKILCRRWREIESDRTYRPGEMDRLFVELDDLVWYIGNVIIKRAIWLTREREKYYGCLFIHVAVIYQEHLPGETLVIADTLVSYRLGNAHSWGAEAGEVLLYKWPTLVASLAVSPSARKKVRSAEPWRSSRWLLVLRGWGAYSLTEYRQWISPRLSSILEKSAAVMVALLPIIMVNALFVFCRVVSSVRGNALLAMRQSRFHPRNW